MLARLEAAFASQRRFVANASHELRTPLTEMRTLIDVTIAEASCLHRAAEAGAGRDRRRGGQVGGTDRGTADPGPLRPRARPAELVDLPTAVEDAIDLIGPAAAARQIRIDTALRDAQSLRGPGPARTAGR